MAGLESLSLPTSVSRVPDIGQGPCQEGAACPAGVGGLRYLPAVQRPFPDTALPRREHQFPNRLSSAVYSKLADRRDSLLGLRSMQTSWWVYSHCS
jgi:hypothetical protein